MNKTKALETLVDAINEKVKQNWNDGTNVTHDIAVLVRLSKECGLIDDFQMRCIFHEADAGYELTYSFLLRIDAVE